MNVSKHITIFFWICYQMEEMEDVVCFCEIQKRDLKSRRQEQVYKVTMPKQFVVLFFNDGLSPRNIILCKPTIGRGDVTENLQLENLSILYSYMNVSKHILSVQHSIILLNKN